MDPDSPKTCGSGGSGSGTPYFGDIEGGRCGSKSSFALVWFSKGFGGLLPLFFAFIFLFYNRYFQFVANVINFDFPKVSPPFYNCITT
jgi:hypothetical protein